MKSISAVIALALACSVSTLAQPKATESTPIFKDYISGLTFGSKMGDLNLTNAGYAMGQFRHFTYSDGTGFGDDKRSLEFVIETNKFMQLQNLKEHSWDQIKKHAMELYRINAMPELVENGYTYKYTGSKEIPKSWAKHGKVLVWTGWQNYPKYKNYIPVGKKHNLHMLAIKGDQCFMATYTMDEEIELESRSANQMVDLILDFIDQDTKP